MKPATRGHHGYSCAYPGLAPGFQPQNLTAFHVVLAVNNSSAPSSMPTASGPPWWPGAGAPLMALGEPLQPGWVGYPWKLAFESSGRVSWTADPDLSRSGWTPIAARQCSFTVTGSGTLSLLYVADISSVSQAFLWPSSQFLMAMPTIMSQFLLSLYSCLPCSGPRHLHPNPTLHSPVPALWFLFLEQQFLQPQVPLWA